MFTGGFLLDPTLIGALERKKLGRALEDIFGTPAEPRVDGAAEDLENLRLTPKQLKEGSRLYRLHCLHCHGVTGDGRGPTAKWVNPHPRDYRQGLFKFLSVDQVSTPDRPPRREDLRRTLEQGIEGTSMPAFNLLSEAELDHLVSYVMHLSIRGKVEFETIKNGFKFNADKKNLEANDEVWGKQSDHQTLADYVKEKWSKDVIKAWVKAQADPIAFKEPYQEKSDEDMKKSVQNGYQIFLDANRAKCDTCHVDFGRRAQFKYDDWGTLVKPADLTRAVYRGGRRPLDLYYRIHSGINGAQMVPFGGTLKKEEEIWDVVNFLQVLPYPAMRAKYKLPIK